MKNRFLDLYFWGIIWATILSSPFAVALTLTEGSAWFGGLVPVCWEAPHPKHRRDRALVQQVMRATWERESAVRFVGWQTCRTGTEGVWISFRDEYPRAIARGRSLDGRSGGVILRAISGNLTIVPNLKTPVHEFGHVLGFGHEYARRDMPTDMIASCAGNYGSGARHLEDDVSLTPFDAHSIMVGCRAHATRDFSRGMPELSPVDIMGVVRLYGSNPRNILDIDEQGDMFGADMWIGDLNRDGHLDLAVAAPGENQNLGATYLYRGTRARGLRPWRVASRADLKTLENLSDVIRAQRIDSAEMLAISATGFPRLEGVAVEGAVRIRVDLNGDGFPETVLGLPNADGGATGSGAVVILRGLPTGRSRPWYWFGQRN